MKHQIFPDLPITEFKSIVLRISGEDWFGNLFRDAMMQSLVKDRDMDIQAYRPAVIYINGEYWGIQNIREKMNEEYIRRLPLSHPYSIVDTVYAQLLNHLHFVILIATHRSRLIQNLSFSPTIVYRGFPDKHCQRFPSLNELH